MTMELAGKSCANATVGGVFGAMSGRGPPSRMSPPTLGRGRCSSRSGPKVPGTPPAAGGALIGAPQCFFGPRRPSLSDGWRLPGQQPKAAERNDFDNLGHRRSVGLAWPAGNAMSAADVPWVPKHPVVSVRVIPGGGGGMPPRPAELRRKKHNSPRLHSPSSPTQAARAWISRLDAFFLRQWITCR